MPRRVRIDNAGYYHIINRGVERRRVFLSKDDKDKFLSIMCEEFAFYKVTLHFYVLMDNHYHLLIETTQKNLSDVMRQVNSKYASYFNKKYNRVGHLWQDRFKSWLVINEDYFFTLFKYFELNPIEAKIVFEYGKFYRSFLYDLLNNQLLTCSKNSYLLQYNVKYILSMLDVELNDIDLARLNSIKKDNRDLKKDLLQKPKDITKVLSTEFTDKESRNLMIVEAKKEGFTQKEIASFYNITPSLVSKIIKKYN